MNFINIITGATASGKSDLALNLAKEFHNIELISADAFQVYRGFNIGTAKPTLAEQSVVKHHLIDIKDPNESYTAGSFKYDAEAVIEDIVSRNKMPIIVGGTGLYIRALTDGLFETPPIDMSIRLSLIEEAERNGSDILYERLKSVDSAYAERISKNDKVRIIRALEVFTALKIPFSEAHKIFHIEPKYRYKIHFISFPREEIYQRINNRVDKMLQNGFIEEVRSLMSEYPNDAPAFRAIGYREIIDYFNALSTLEETAEKIKMLTRRYAKRQYTWFSSQADIAFRSNSKDIYELIAGSIL